MKLKTFFLPIVALILFALAFILSTSRFSRPPLPGEREERGTSGAMQALDDWSRARAYPGYDIPADAYMKAVEASKAFNKHSARSPLQSFIWEPIGPVDNDNSNGRGRSISVAINPQNPNTIYCGTASGGLWRSHQASTGGDWVRLPLGVPALGIGAITIDPADSNIIYVGTGEVYRYGYAVGGLIVRTTRGSYGVGILKSTDGGTTWTKSLDWSYNQQRGVQQIKINPLNKNTVFAATTEGVYRSTDAGANWTQTLPVVMATDLAIDRNDTTLVLAACGNFKSPGYGIYLSPDGGTTWGLVPGGVSNYSGKAHLDTYYANPDIVYASIADSTTGAGSLWRSSSFGGSWTQVNTDAIFGVQGWYSHFVAIKPNDSSQIVHCGLSPYKSTNGGSTFTGAFGGYSDNHNFAYEPGHPNILYIVNDNGIFRSTDFGLNYTDIGKGMQTLQFYNGFSNSQSDSLLAAGQSQDHIPGYVYHGAITWTRGVVDEVGWTAIDPTNDNVMYATARGDQTGTSVYKSTDRGVSFFGLSGFSGYANWDSPVVIAPSSPNVLYVGLTTIYKSINSGGFWSVTNGGAAPDGNPTLSMSVSSTSPDTAIAGMAPFVTRAHVVLTTNGGTTWTDITGTLPDRYPMDVAINPKNSKVFYATFGGFGTGHIFKSTNLGTSWTDISGTLPDAPTPAVLVDPVDTSVVFVGNDIGVYMSTNGGASWSGYSEGLPEAVIAADLSMNLSAHKLRIATHGNGVYERKVVLGAPVINFDYKAFGFTSPTTGSQILFGSSLSGLTATFRNNGAQAQTDSFDVKYRILQNGSQVFSSTARTAGLALSEVRPVTFGGTFAPPDTGDYTLEAISLAADQDASNDTARGTLRVILAPTITSLQIVKQNCTYTEITGGSPGPIGDDVQLTAHIPFNFTFDGYSYDSVQISTNGWLEFGTGTAGSLRGISTPGQVGGFFNPVLATTARPTKVIAPWWADLATGSIGAISYKSTGSAPNRTFIIQWKNVLAYYDEANSNMKINFQIWLNETSNTFEFHYGPVVPGTFTGGGAEIGFKDHIGGDYHYYDLPAGKTGLVSELTQNHSPVTGWMGPDTCYTMQAGGSTLVLSYAPNWNLVSVPVVSIDSTVGGVFPTALNARAFEYSGGSYHIKDTLTPGKGFWVKFASSGLQQFTGTPVSSTQIALEQGWNMIGSVDHNISAPTGGIVTSQMWEYNGVYAPSTTIVPGKAYWVKTSAAGTINLGPVSEPKQKSRNLDAYNKLVFSDRSGATQTLYIADDPSRAINADLYSMPPIPPAGFDARFGSQRLLESVTDRSMHEFPVSVVSESYPVAIRWTITSGANATLVLNDRKIPMTAGGAAIMTEAPSVLKVQYGNPSLVPAVFSLSQNYPNPFNPSTRVKYELAEASRVTLKIYNILGEEVASLVANELQPAGAQSVEWNAASMPSGIYLCRITAGSFTESRKMLLIK